MPMTLLQLLREVNGRLAQPLPGIAIGTTDAGTLQQVGLMNELLEDLQTRKMWQTNLRQVEHIALAQEDQGSIHTICPLGYQGIVGGTMFNRTTQLPVDGGIGAAEWQARQNLRLTGPIPQFRIRNDRLLMFPAPVAGHRYFWEYCSTYFVFDPTNSTYHPYWQKDTDLFVLNDAIALSWLRWAWKKEKGLDYGEDFAKYEALVAVRGVRDDAPMQLDMAGGPSQRLPGIIVPAGSWSV